MRQHRDQTDDPGRDVARPTEVEREVATPVLRSFYDCARERRPEDGRDPAEGDEEAEGAREAIEAGDVDQDNGGQADLERKRKVDLEVV